MRREGVVMTRALSEPPSWQTGRAAM